MLLVVLGAGARQVVLGLALGGACALADAARCVLGAGTLLFELGAEAARGVLGLEPNMACLS